MRKDRKSYEGLKEIFLFQKLRGNVDFLIQIIMQMVQKAK